MSLGIILFGYAASALKPAIPSSKDGHQSGLAARITLADGTARTVRLDGVGCSVAICSRTEIKSKTEARSLLTTWLDTISAITSTAPNRATLTMKDSSERAISLLADFRVLYVTNASGGSEKIDLANTKSVEFVPASHLFTH
jgi:hypothetical protein